MEQQIRIEGLQKIMIHSSEYVRVYYSIGDDTETVYPCQVPIEAIDTDLKVGDQAIATMLLRTVMEIRHAAV